VSRRDGAETIDQRGKLPGAGVRSPIEPSARV